MKYLLSIIALTLSLNAQGIPDHPPGQGENRRKPPEILKEFREEMLKKYDTNKDGKLDREERSKNQKQYLSKIDRFLGAIEQQYARLSFSKLEFKKFGLGSFELYLRAECLLLSCKGSNRLPIQYKQRKYQ